MKKTETPASCSTEKEGKYPVAHFDAFWSLGFVSSVRTPLSNPLIEMDKGGPSLIRDFGSNWDDPMVMSWESSKGATQGRQGTVDVYTIS